MPVMQHVLQAYDPSASHQSVAEARAAWMRYAASL
jgi:hypothetical protein